MKQKQQSSALVDTDEEEEEQKKEPPSPAVPKKTVGIPKVSSRSHDKGSGDDDETKGRLSCWKH
jgi:hypothetical protein